MASPMHYGSQMGGWQNNNMAQNQNQPMPQGNASYEEPGPQVRPMGLKVHYAFDRDNTENYLTRPPHTFQIQTLQVDEASSIGVVDLRICVQAVIDNSPEITGQQHDYTIYAYDYTEDDTPLVGQGMLSWVASSMGNNQPSQEPKMVTGMVTKNLRAVFGGGNKENLEVKLKLVSSARRPEPPRPMDARPMNARPLDIPQNRPMEPASTPTAMTPTGMTEWSSFMQSNPQIGQPQLPPRGASPAVSHASFGGHSHAPSQSFNQAPQPNEIQRVAPTPVDPSNTNNLPTAPSSRPSSRTSNRAPRKKKPTGRPVGRPKKKKPVEGTTSGYEDGTEGDEPPTKKRAVTTTVERSVANPFAAGSESLRVAASTSGSLRNFRPVGVSSEVAAAPNHLQEIPRAPTPIPDGLSGLPGRAPFRGKTRRESTMSREFNPAQSQYAEARLAPFIHEDSRSPDSIGATPTYSEDSPLDIGSSPPVARTTPYLRSSPPQSSPLLPPMPVDHLPRLGEHQDVGLGSMDMDEMFADESFQARLQEDFTQLAQSREAIEEAIDKSGVPQHVFQMQPGPAGQSMVHIRNYNTPHPTSTPVGPPDSASLPPLRKEPQTSMTAGQVSGPPTHGGPSPQPLTPPTTDFLDLTKSPAGGSKGGPSNQQTRPAQVLPANDRPASSESGSRSQEEVQAPPQAAGAANDLSLSRQTGPPTDATTKPVNPPKPKRQRARKPPRELTRSQSAGPAMLAPPPASEPAGPSTLGGAKGSGTRKRIPAALKRSATMGPHTHVVPASDSAVPLADSVAPELATLTGLVLPQLPQAVCPQSDLSLALPSSPTGTRFNKNVVKKNAIKQRLEDAIRDGEMPPFCNNCGAIETPTWRKIWTQDHEGEPPELDFSEKPGKVTAIEVLEREDDAPKKYRLVMKSLGEEDRAEWRQMLLCNPCGIWLAKAKGHRPRDRWDKDASRQGRKRSSTGTNPRPKKPKNRGDPANPTSEAYLLTDAMEPMAPTSPRVLDEVSALNEVLRSGSPGGQGSVDYEGADDSAIVIDIDQAPSDLGSQDGDATKSPKEKELEATLGDTRRLLFPSPRKDGIPKVLGELDVNIVQTGHCEQSKQPVMDKENLANPATEDADDDLEALFRSPAVQRPCTPPPGAKSTAAQGQFKTPTRPTPSHRPVTRSVTRSIRSVRDLDSPFRLEVESPTSSRSRPMRTPSSRNRRSPRNQGVMLIGEDGLLESNMLFLENSEMGELNLQSPSGPWIPSLPGDAGTPSPATRRILDMLSNRVSGSPSPGRKRLNQMIGQDMDQLDWTEMLKSPSKRAFEQTTQGVGDWYKGSADAFDEWMKEGGNA